MAMAKKVIKKTMVVNENFLTFIIPTMGRQSLERAVSSAINQKDPSCRALVVYDNRYDVNYTSDNGRITIIKADVGGHAGFVRNYGIERADSEWIAFLDDDDWVEPTYVERLKLYLEREPDLGIVIFTYKDVTNGNIQPRPRTRQIVECGVGISFAVKTSIIKENNIRFTPYAIEDFRFLDECIRAGAKYKITHDIQYMVGGIGGWIRKD